MWRKETLDILLVPLGVLVLVAYQLFLIHRLLWWPLTTVIGVNHVNRMAWVRNVMRDTEKSGVLAVQTIRNSIMASTLLASTAITLSSLIGAVVTGTASGRSNVLLYGSSTSTIVTVKYLSILVCFLFAFVCHVQAIRYASHVSFLVTIPIGGNAPGLTPEYVSKLLLRGSNFFSLGNRGFYFSFPLLMWLFGPIPMFVCSCLIVLFLYYTDSAIDFRATLLHLSDSGSDFHQETKGSKLVHYSPEQSV